MKVLKKIFLIMILSLSFSSFAKIKLQPNILFSLDNILGVPIFNPRPSFYILYEFPHKNIFSFSLGAGLNYFLSPHISALTEFSWQLKELKKTNLSLVFQLEGGVFPFPVTVEDTGYYGLATANASSSIMTEWAWKQKRFYLRTGLSCFLYIKAMDNFYKSYWLGIPLTFGWRFG